MRVDVFLDTGVCVNVPEGVDPDSNEGYRVIKGLAERKFREILDSGFDIQFEATPEFDEPQEEETDGKPAD